MIRIFFVSLFAGLAAGIGTGFAGLSAATVIAPMLISFCGYPWYESIAIGLASDVLASAFSAFIYWRNKNIDVKNGIYMLISVLVMTFVGSYFSQYMPDLQMGYLTIFAALFMGLNLLASRNTGGIHIKFPDWINHNILALICGACIGLYCGFMGVGGGMMMLLILTCVLGYELKMAVGTSVLIMTFTALTGAASHFYFGDVTSYIPALVLCAMFTLIGAVVSAHFANRMKAQKNNQFTGTLLMILGVFMLGEKVLSI